MAVVATVGANQFATVAANTITLGATGSKAQDFEDAILTAVIAKYDSTETTANTHQTKVSIRNTDSSNNDFEHCLVTWNTGGTMTIDDRLETSTGSAITWTGQVVVSGIATYEEVHHGSIITIQEGLDTTTSGAVTTSSTTMVRLFDSISITPTSDLSYLSGVADFKGYIQRTSSGIAVSGEIRVGYVNSSSVDTTSTTPITIGANNLPTNDADMFFYQPTSLPFVLDQTHLNASGDWELLIMGRVLNTGRQIVSEGEFFKWEERLAT